MNWLIKNLRPGIKRISGFLRHSNVSEDFWIKCPKTGRLVPRVDVEKNLWVIPGSEHHLSLSALQRLTMTFDGPWEDILIPETSSDPLKFRDRRWHSERLKDVRKKTGMRDAVMLGFGTIESIPVVVGAHDFRFVGGTVGIAAGETVMMGFRSAVEKKAPLVIFTASGGARLQEGIFSLMQLPRTTIAVMEMQEAKLPFIVVLTHPTMGGTTASYGMLGDIHIAEPGAEIGFAGRRVIEEVTKEIPPPGFQDAEKLLEHGMVDMIVHRRDMRKILARLCRLLVQTPARA